MHYWEFLYSEKYGSNYMSNYMTIICLMSPLCNIPSPGGTWGGPKTAIYYELLYK